MPPLKFQHQFHCFLLQYHALAELILLAILRPFDLLISSISQTLFKLIKISFKCLFLEQRYLTPLDLYETNKLNPELKILNPKKVFKDSTLSFIKTKENLVFIMVHDAVGLKLLTRPRLGFSHLNTRK